MKNKGGRPAKEIDKNIFERLCAIQCTREEICSVLGVSVPTLHRWCKREYKESFETVFKSKSELGKSSLRRIQFELAKKSSAMAIFLGKQYLGQKDTVDTNALQRIEVVTEVPKDD